MNIFESLIGISAKEGGRMTVLTYKYRPESTICSTIYLFLIGFNRLILNKNELNVIYFKLNIGKFRPHLANFPMNKRKLII